MFFKCGGIELLRPVQTKKLDLSILYLAMQWDNGNRVLIDKNLSWKDQDAIATKISKNVGLIAKLRHYIPRKILLNFYKSLIHPYLTYGLPAWGQAGKTYLNKILILQKRALRLLFFGDIRDHAIPLFLKANVLPITFLYHECVSSLMYDINDNNAPTLNPNPNLYYVKCP